ncbi:argininosuccinate lyase [Bartonella elizabethae Re6043vi]|uniref:Argininosuccinate lyase n=2 Tax=Bartonella elizabethae TaxID=807 RepID=J0RMY0_BAREL|nr:argininosuccinate lyase [Bartonella elizabethae Re6043vi]EJF96939.1 argininosuccinate lyase [Bartonella elizabethae F9251 = ATCC 49927]VEJ42108.1 argininosuccinate lyase [Bartonella elizabethae]
MYVWWLIVKLAVVMEEINTLIDIDQKLYRQYIKGSLSLAAILAQTKIILQSGCEKISYSLEIIFKEIKEGTFVFSRTLEDISYEY